MKMACHTIKRIETMLIGDTWEDTYWFIEEQIKVFENKKHWPRFYREKRNIYKNETVESVLNFKCEKLREVVINFPYDDDLPDSTRIKINDFLANCV
jgi:hypothetical protein